MREHDDLTFWEVAAALGIGAVISILFIWAVVSSPPYGGTIKDVAAYGVATEADKAMLKKHGVFTAECSSDGRCWAVRDNGERIKIR